MTQTAPYGSWDSPISARMLGSSVVRPDQLALRDGVVYWTEMRPTEGGRYVLVSSDGRGPGISWTPPGFNVRTRVHEYGGGAFCLHEGVVYFSNFVDQRIYRQTSAEADPVPLTPEPPEAAGIRFADGRVTPDGRWIVCVRESHSGDGVDNEIVAVDTVSGEQSVLVTGADFYAYPRLDASGTRLAYINWDHPNMPWDDTVLCVVDFADGEVKGEPYRVAGGPGESVLQPEWSPDGILHFVSDRNNWWNIFAETDGAIACVYEAEAEFGAPMWTFGTSNYDFLEDGTIAAIYTERGTDRLGIISGGELTKLETPFSAFGLARLRAEGRHLVAHGGGPATPLSVQRVHALSGEVDTLARSMEMGFDAAYVSEATPIEFPTEGGHTAHAFYYPPTNPGFSAADGQLPPLLVECHGGPTSHVDSMFNLEHQFWTSRGFAIVDVNYGGSTGYGRDYRERLKGRWGVVDVDDCIHAARYLIGQGGAAADRVAIRGGSAGGYTTLSSLAFRDFYAAGASHFGLGDLEAFVGITHKFEERYLDSLVGPYPEAAETYRERSAVPHADQISCPVILFQGLEDEVVPPAQAEQVVEALEQKGLPYAYLAFEGEQHGFRRSETIERVAKAELYFYARVFGFELPPDVGAIEIHNL